MPSVFGLATEFQKFNPLSLGEFWAFHSDVLLECDPVMQHHIPEHENPQLSLSQTHYEDQVTMYIIYKNNHNS
jgi:hypothetical protein